MSQAARSALNGEGCRRRRGIRKSGAVAQPQLDLSCNISCLTGVGLHAVEFGAFTPRRLSGVGSRRTKPAGEEITTAGLRAESDCH